MALLNKFKNGYIDKNDKGFSNCLRIFFSKIKELILLNLLFIVSMIPYIIAAAFITYVVLPDTHILPGINIPFPIQIMLIFAPFAFCGPFVAALTKITRDIGREEHVFLVKDFFGAANKFKKQGTLFSFFGYLFYVAAFFALLIYSGAWFLFGAALICTIYITLMFKYIFLMIVSLKLNPSKLIKNGFLLVLANIKKSAVGLIVLIFDIILLGLQIFAAAQNSIFIVFLVISLAIVYFSFSSYFENYFYFQGIIDKVVDPYYANMEKGESSDIKSDIDSYKDNNKYKNEENITEKTEYIYKDGKLVRKDLLDKESIFED